MVEKKLYMVYNPTILTDEIWYYKNCMKLEELKVNNFNDD